MVKFALLTAIAAFASTVLAADIPPEMEWMIVDTHTPQPNCLTATNRKCDVIDFAKITQECSHHTQIFSARVDKLSSYRPEQFLKDTKVIADDWMTTAKMINASLPLPQEKDFYQRMAVADMVHWTLHLPLFTVFHKLVEDKKKIRFPKSIVYKGIKTISDSSDRLAIDAFDYLPTEPPIIREQIGMLGQWLHDEFANTLKEFE